MAKLFIANIPSTARESDIIAFFAAENIQASNVRIRTDKEISAKRFGFADVPDADEENALRLSGSSLLNRKLVIDRARTTQGGRR